MARKDDKSAKHTAANDGARSALAAAFLRHREGLRRFIARLVIRPEDVDDILQETFLNAFGVRDINAIESPRFYLYAVARRTAYRELKRQSARIARSIEEAAEHGEEPADGIVVDDAVYARMHFEALAGVVADLPVQCRRVFILRKIFGYSHKEISVSMGISISTVEKHLGRAMMRCMQDQRLRAFQEPDARTAGEAVVKMNE